MKKGLRAPWILSIFFAFLYVSCDVTISVQTYDLSGTAVDVTADNTSTTWSSALAGALVTMTDTDSGKKRTATVSASGAFSFSDVKVGRYQINASKTDWVFVPRTIDISGASGTLPNLLAYMPADAGTIYIITEWQEATIDVDSHVIIDNANDFSVGTSFPVTDGHHVYSGRTSYDSSVYLDRDITVDDIAAGKPAVETVRIASNPFSSPDTTGWIKFYLDTSAGSEAGTLTGNSAYSIKDARATVHVMQNDTWLGTYPLATETEESTLMVLKIFVEENAGQTAYTISSPGNFDGQYRSVR